LRRLLPLKYQPKGFDENAATAKSGGSLAKAAREQLESQLGRSVISSVKDKDCLLHKNENDNEEI
jgi:hypothetical protein